MAEYKIGVRIGHGTKPIIGVIVRADDYFYIDHRSTNGLAEIAEAFGKSSVEWFNVVNDLNRLIESGADLRPLGDAYLEVPWQKVDAAAGAAVGAYFKLLSADLRVSLEGDRDSAHYVIVMKHFASHGAITREEAVRSTAHVQGLQTLLEASGATPASIDRSISMLDAIDQALSAVQASDDPNDVQPRDCLSAALSSLRGYEGWATSSCRQAVTALS